MIKIAVSACLLGKNVRYDGKNKYVDLDKYFDSNRYQLCGICPEVEMGMSIPREPIQIIQNNNGIKLVNVENQNIDHSETMTQWFQNSLCALKKYQGFILKSKSPSCGNQTTIHYSFNNHQNLSDGYFVLLLKQQINNPLIIDENSLLNQNSLSQFKKKLTLS